MAIKPREYYQVSVGRNFPSTGEQAPAWLVDLAYDLNRCCERTPATKNKFETGDPKALLSQVQAPTLILWGMNNPTVMHLEGDVIDHWLSSAPSLLIKYPGLGHYPYIEASNVVNTDILRFLEGAMDADLRVTQRVKP